MDSTSAMPSPSAEPSAHELQCLAWLAGEIARDELATRGSGIGNLARALYRQRLVAAAYERARQAADFERAETERRARVSSARAAAWRDSIEHGGGRRRALRVVR